MAKKKVKAKETYNPDNVAKIMALWEKVPNKDDYEEFAAEIGKWYQAGEVSDADIIQLQYENPPISPLIVIIEISNHMHRGESGYTYHEAKMLAAKLQFIYLCNAEAKGMDLHQAFRNSTKPYEDAVDEIFNDTYDKEKLALLKSFPEYNVWKEQGGVKISVEYFDTFFKK